MKQTLEAAVRFWHVEAVAPSLKDNTADIDRLKRELLPLLGEQDLIVPYSRVVHVAEKFRQFGFKGIAVLHDLPHGLELVDFLESMPSVAAGLALDLGTTHLEASLVNLLTGEILSEGHCPNPQIRHGADILARIQFADKQDGLQQLKEDVVGAINSLAGRLSAEVSLTADSIWAISVSGNTTMSHFFLGLTPYHICREPYIPQVNTMDPCPAPEIGLQLHPAAKVWVLPSSGSYFGGDLISGIVASGLDQAEEVNMLIDVGTNAEVILGNRDWLIACAGAAGPALEGGVARMGMRAGPGAIEHVEIDPETGKLTYTTIDNAAPKGICGSGIIDLVAGLYLSEMIDIRGKFRPAAMGERLVTVGDERAFIVATADEADGEDPVLLSQVDLDALMRSKAAMYAILTTLVNQVGVEFEQLARIHVAGAFGRHIAPQQAIVLGMLPDLPLDTYKPVGNSSKAGAEQFLLHRDFRKRCDDVVQRITYIELNVNQEFMIRFSGSRFIPHTDHTLFPSVPFFGNTD